MKVIKVLCLLSVAVFPLASVSTAPVAQPVMAEPTECAPMKDVNLCGRCGDGQCVKSCGENKDSCPIDCGGIVSL
ncbi:MAG TPA: hypothetical protein VK539_17155 [Myxococcaceae bacterium]|nr:hypothetical protein [Myxococcaceae bacterium]